MGEFTGKGRSGGEILRRGFLKGTAVVIGGMVVSSLAVFLSACAPGEGSVVGSPGSNEVWITSGGFVPAVINVQLDTTVTWTNRDRKVHTVISDTPPSDTSNTSDVRLNGSLKPGGSFSYTFNKHGVFRYHCDKYPKMTGRVFVRPKEGEDCVSCHDQDMTPFLPQ